MAFDYSFAITNDTPSLRSPRDASKVMLLVNELKARLQSLSDEDFSSLTESGAPIAMDPVGGHSHDGISARLASFAVAGGVQGLVQTQITKLSSVNLGAVGTWHAIALPSGTSTVVWLQYFIVNRTVGRPPKFETYSVPTGNPDERADMSSIDEGTSPPEGHYVAVVPGSPDAVYLYFIWPGQTDCDVYVMVGAV